MVHCFTVRKGSILAEPVWRTAPWAHATKDREQMLYDHGFSLACLLEQADALAQEAVQHGPSKPTFELLLQLMKSSLDLNRSLDQFRDNQIFSDESRREDPHLVNCVSRQMPRLSTLTCL